MSESSQEVRSRKWTITVNEDQIKKEGWTHERLIKEAIEPLKPQYYALADEIGTEAHHLHTHIILYRSSAIRAKTILKRFPKMHNEALKGTMAEARTYIRKEGKWENTEKSDTPVPDSFEEYGDLPREPGRGAHTELEWMMDLVKNGESDLEIIEKIPSLVTKISAIQHYRQLVIEEQAHEYRKMDVIYIFGKTGTGKTRSVYQNYDSAEICTINDYNGTGIFDAYDSSRVKILCLDEFRSSITFNLLLSLTDGNFQTINCRYSNRTATHTTVLIISNITLLEQYPNIQQTEPESWKALLRRISEVRFYYALGKYKSYTVEQYLEADRMGYFTDWQEVDPDSTPFSEKASDEASQKDNFIDVSSEQISLPFQDNE